MKIGGIDLERFEFMSSGNFPDSQGMVKVYYISGRSLECPIHGFRSGDGLYCKVCGKMLQYAVLEACYAFGTVYIDTDQEVEIV